MITLLVLIIIFTALVHLTIFFWQKAIEKEKGIQHERKPLINHIFTDEYLQSRREKQTKKAQKLS
ncbi:hypothetical protein [Listeria fleischmannii]|uniref:Uncharacterized protein n=1 Tax=Listeria fleischmannii FSL S10-1203 TaxID=1265822 RepID=W7DAU3_9LIST|nr:hypothetical protein [Listeria fleischmannii]EUJ46200.1 hypothetical protein MCOL2_19094 [Listeria fleischmannii FSL S10-1203]